MSSAITSTALLALKALDTDKSGSLTATELKKGAALLPDVVREAVAKQGAASFLKSVDANGDGSVSLQELASGLTSLVNTSTLDALTKAQESQSQLDQMQVGLKSSLLSLLSTGGSGAASSHGAVAEQVLAAYAAAGKL